MPDTGHELLQIAPVDDTGCSPGSAAAGSLFSAAAASGRRSAGTSRAPGLPGYTRHGALRLHRAAGRGVPHPDVCRLLGIAVDDACRQPVYQATDDPAICDRLYLRGVVPTCKAYYELR